MTLPPIRETQRSFGVLVLALGVVLASLAAPDRALAEESATSLRVALDPAIPVSPEDVVRRLSASLALDVRLTSLDDASARVHVRSARGRAARIEVSSARGRPTRRRITLPRREDERAAALALHIESLLRDDASALLSLLDRRRLERRREAPLEPTAPTGSASPPDSASPP
ncbi:MAG: hypothetical protein K1X94_13860, partial [Sandaracinaceae bacterium]|nr:hypothetical protein [Sandaracinaceae bacterium]